LAALEPVELDRDPDKAGDDGYVDESTKR